MTPSTAEWVHKAEGDFDAVPVLRRLRKRSRFDVVCFRCQQCIGKYFKARLNHAALSIPKSHDLRQLAKRLIAVEPLWVGMAAELKELTAHAVAGRYPGASADAAMARDAYRTCVRARELARASLGLKP